MRAGYPSPHPTRLPAMDLDFLEEPVQQPCQQMDFEFSGRPPSSMGLRILLLDADPSAIDAARRQLCECGNQTSSCSGLSAACQLLLSQRHCHMPFDLVLADLPSVINGGDNIATGCGAVLRQLLEAAAYTPLVLMGACCSPKQVLAGVQCGAVHFLEKPLSPQMLSTLWQHSVRRSMGQQNGTLTSHHSHHFNAHMQPGHAAAASAADFTTMAKAEEAALHSLATAHEDPLGACCSLLDEVDTTFTRFDSFSAMLTDEDVYQEVDALLGHRPSESGGGGSSFCAGFSTATSSGDGWMGEGSYLVRSEADSSGADATSAKPPAKGTAMSSCDAATMEPSASGSLPLVAGTPAAGIAAAPCLAPVPPVMVMSPPGMCSVPGLDMSTWLPPGMVWGMPCPIVATVPGMAMRGVSWPAAAMPRSTSMFLPGACMMPPHMFAAPAAGRVASQHAMPSIMHAASAPVASTTAAAAAPPPPPCFVTPPHMHKSGVSCHATGASCTFITNAVAASPAPQQMQPVPCVPPKEACAGLLPNELLFGSGCRPGASASPLGLKLHKSASLAELISKGLSEGVSVPV